MDGFVDPYVDPATGILRNRVGARTRAELDRAEGDLSFAAMIELLTRPPRPTGDLAELRAIHRGLFADVYGWAGEIRTVDIRKDAEGAEFFLPVSMIDRAASFTAEELRADDMLRGLDRRRFVQRLAHHYDQLNYIHPFAEGNRRTQRLFWDRVARDAGRVLDWRRVSGAENDRASRIASESRDLTPLCTMLERVVVPAAPRPRAASAARDRSRLGGLGPRRDTDRGR
ncbi:Fic/DOC family protein [Clavibacter michiganensis]|uniref:protein adenylyltransferase n=1 Tax=Clavibacter michiganensis subsp. insidiosus TaxID=33014 RepID=A0A0D5CEX7_9MICO|nr:Fic family protein [Clavibacter michiganensis]AJW77860.1 toxin Fic [Clavibacter michiganensis subsp. insidiosus]AWF97013.1 toxin Fic [Clavibacter michiganensis subsp. insidiosus]AWG00081.1 toxin Fic [Clavibacter michiganensis subsp. insidiosus]OQJ58556.1 cell filamentation protein Fic [Clavibacter michiganensis subsp. insidiosus]RII87491.1 cell filamentation protein Fic [Clavibacter michiganensis subsp. insidiosus]